MSSVEILGFLKKNLGIIIKRLEESGIIVLPYAAKFINRTDQTITPGDWLTILEMEAAGNVEEFFIHSPNTDFKIQIVVNGSTVLEKTYEELREIQQNSRDVSAFAELDEEGNPTGYYIASIRNVSCETSMVVKVQNTGATPTTLPNIFAKYKTLGE